MTLAAGCHEIGVKTVTAALRKHRAAGPRSAHAQIFSSFDRLQCAVLLEPGEELGSTDGGMVIRQYVVPHSAAGGLTCSDVAYGLAPVPEDAWGRREGAVAGAAM